MRMEICSSKTLFSPLTVMTLDYKVAQVIVNHGQRMHMCEPLRMVKWHLTMMSTELLPCMHCNSSVYMITLIMPVMSPYLKR